MPAPRYIEVPTEVYMLGERLRLGDPTMGWRGDPSMILWYDPGDSKYKVTARDGHGKEYVAWSGHKIGPRVLAELAANDWQRGRAVFTEMHAAEAARQKADEDAERDRRFEIHEKFQHAINAAFRHLEGGGRRVFAASTWQKES